MRLMGAIELSGGWHFDSLRVPGVLDDVPDGISRWNPGDICRSFTALGPSIDWQERDLGGEGRELCYVGTNSCYVSLGHELIRQAVAQTSECTYKGYFRC